MTSSVFQRKKGHLQILIVLSQGKEWALNNAFVKSKKQQAIILLGNIGMYPFKVYFCIKING